MGMTRLVLAIVSNRYVGKVDRQAGQTADSIAPSFPSPPANIVALAGWKAAIFFVITVTRGGDFLDALSALEE